MRSWLPNGCSDPAMSWQFDDETVVHPTGEGRWTTTVSDRWNIGDKPNGGYLLTPVLRALVGLGPHADPVSVTTHFLRPGSAPADGQIRGGILRAGRSVTTSRGALVQGGTTRIEMTAAFGDLGDGDGEPRLSVAPPAAVDPDRCVARSGEDQGVQLSISDRVDVRLDPATEGPEVVGWIRFSDGRPADSLAAVLFSDAFPPSVFNLYGRIGWVPTIELTVHVRRRPAPGWMLGRFVTDDLHDGRMIEHGWLWDTDGALVAQSRQLAMLLPA